MATGAYGACAGWRLALGRATLFSRLHGLPWSMHNAHAHASARIHRIPLRIPLQRAVQRIRLYLFINILLFLYRLLARAMRERLQNYNIATALTAALGLAAVVRSCPCRPCRRHRPCRRRRGPHRRRRRRPSFPARRRLTSLWCSMRAAR